MARGIRAPVRARRRRLRDVRAPPAALGRAVRRARRPVSSSRSYFPLTSFFLEVPAVLAGLAHDSFMENEANEETLLCDFHVHTTVLRREASDGRVVDLFGRSGHDVIAITDHIADTKGVLGRAARALADRDARKRPGVLRGDRQRGEASLARVSNGRPAREPRSRDNAAARDAVCHILALGITEFLSADRSAAPDPARDPPAGRRFGRVPPARESRVDRQHVLPLEPPGAARASGRPLGARVPLGRLSGRRRGRNCPSIATGDFHSEEHLYAWKTLIRARRDAESVLAALRSPAPLAITQLQPPAEPLPAWVGVPTFA